MMKPYKRIVLAAAALLTFTLQSYAASATFIDLSSTPAKDKIISLYEKGVMKGIDTEHFAPNATMTAAQGIQLIVKALDLNLSAITFIKAPLATDFFENADNEAWYAGALIIAGAHDLDLPRDLDPNALWTREDFTHQLMLALEKHSDLPLIKIIPVSINDESELNVAYSGSIQRALVLGIAKLDNKGQFHPKTPITRAEAAELTFQALEYLKAHPASAGSLGQ